MKDVRESDGSCIALIPRSKDWFEPGLSEFGISNSSACAGCEARHQMVMFLGQPAPVGGNPPQNPRGAHVA